MKLNIGNMNEEHEKRLTNCPNCGAPIEGIKCKYCGTLHFDVADICSNHPKYIRIPIGDMNCMFNVIATDIELEQEYNETEFYSDNVRYEVQRTPEMNLKLNLKVVPDDKGIYAMKREKGWKQ